MEVVTYALKRILNKSNDYKKRLSKWILGSNENKKLLKFRLREIWKTSKSSISE